MYLCEACGNKKFFIENICLSNFICLDEETGEFVRQYEQKSDIAEVVCGRCGASTEDEDVVERNG